MALAEDITATVSDLKSGQIRVLAPPKSIESDHVLHLHVMDTGFLTG